MTNPIYPRTTPHTAPRTGVVRLSGSLILVVLSITLAAVSNAAMAQDKPVALTPTREFQAHQSLASALLFSHDGAQLISADGGGAIHIWDARTYRLRSQMMHQQTGVGGMALDPTGRTLLAGGSPYLSFWNVRGRQPIMLGRLTQSGVGMSAIAISSDGKVAATGGAAGMVTFWSIERNKERQLVAHQKVHGRKTLDIRVVAKTGQMASVGTNGAVKLWDPSTGKQSAVPVKAKPVPQPAKKGRGVPDAVNQAAFSHDGSLVACTTEQGFVLYEVTTGKEQTRIATPGLSLRRLAFSADGLLVAASHNGPGGGFTVYDTKSGRLVGVNKDATKSIDCLAFSPKVDQLITGSKQTLAVWDITPLRIR